MSAGRGLLAVLAAGVVVASSLVVPPLAVPAGAVPAGADEDVSVPGRVLPVLPVEPNPAEEATQVTSAGAAEPAWPGAGAAVLEVPVAAGRSMAGAVAASPPVAGVSVLADGAAAEAVRPGDGVGHQRSGPGPASAVVPRELGGLAPGGLARVRLAGQPRAAAEALGAAQVFTVERSTVRRRRRRWTCGWTTRATRRRSGATTPTGCEWWSCRRAR